jgi:hypothetical protein
MAKAKKKKKIDLNSQKTVTILVPDTIGDLENKVLHGIGRLTVAATSTFDVTDVAIVKTSQLTRKIGGPIGWQKSVNDE